MRWIINVFLIALLSFALCLYLPWWTIAIAAFLVAFLIPVKPGYAFIAGFVSLFLLWGALSLFLSVSNHHLLAGKISTLILQKESPYLLILLTATIGAVVGGFAALSGSLFRKVIIK
jgi:hypothetical protein